MSLLSTFALPPYQLHEMLHVVHARSIQRGELRIVEGRSIPRIHVIDENGTEKDNLLTGPFEDAVVRQPNEIDRCAFGPAAPERVDEVRTAQRCEHQTGKHEITRLRVVQIGSHKAAFGLEGET
jgi:hypothetical protein